MSDFDPDAYLSTLPDQLGTPFDPDAHLSSAVPEKTPGADFEQLRDIGKAHPLTFAVGAGENLLGGVTGQFGQLANAATGWYTGEPPGTHNWAYQPRTEAGKQIAAVAQGEGKKIGGSYDQAFGTGPLATTLKERIPEALGATGAVSMLGGMAGSVTGGAARTGLSEGLSEVDNPQSISAAAATPNLASASPSLKAAVQEVRNSGGQVNPQVLERHLEAESLPVPAQLTKGQATQDPVLMSIEQNARGKNPTFANRFNEQNQNLIDNLQAIRDKVGPDVFSTNPVEHGQSLIDAYKAKNAAAEADIASKYQALKDANGGDFPVDAKGLFSNVTKSLHDNYLFEHAPSAELRQLGNAADSGNMTFEKYEAMRTNLARTMRTSSDGNEIAAAGVIRNEMEKLPLTGDAATLKPLADTARAAARNQFQALRQDPAYNAAVSDKVSPDRFVSRFIVNGDAKNVATMKQNLADNPAAQQTMSVAALDHLRNAAGVDDLYRGNFGQSGFNKNLQALSPKLSQLFAPQDAQTLSTLGSVARNQQFQPRGSFVNNSNTTVSAMAENSKAVLEHMADAKTAGAWSLLAKPILKGRAAKQLAEEHLSPGAGLDYGSP